MMLVLVILICFTSLFTVIAQTVCRNQTGMHDDYYYELWIAIDSENIDIVDALLTAQYYVGLINSFC
ncbi:MAG: hypothetical protein JXB88_22060 [Spirochaetales bacterium]|nr:hypothetical protein [Spirochaetales bacterium]